MALTFPEVIELLFNDVSKFYPWLLICWNSTFIISLRFKWLGKLKMSNKTLWDFVCFMLSDDVQSSEIHRFHSRHRHCNRSMVKLLLDLCNFLILVIDCESNNTSDIGYLWPNTDNRNLLFRCLKRLVCYKYCDRGFGFHLAPSSQMWLFKDWRKIGH